MEKSHECEALVNTDVKITVKKIAESWYWVFWGGKKGNQAHGIAYCPYCGEKLK